MLNSLRALSRPFFFAVLLSSFVLPSAADAADHRVTKGLQVFYDFSGDGSEVQDRSDSDNPLNLEIRDPDHVQWNDGQLKIRQPTLLQFPQKPQRLIDALRKSGELTVEVWCQPANDSQSGPARLITISKDSSQRNLTLGQDGNRFDVRLRTTKTSTNGLPSVQSPKGLANSKLLHVVYSRTKSGQTVLYINGNGVASESVPGKLSNWDTSHRLAIGNELTSDRPWLGTLHLAAIYSTALNKQQVRQNFEAGPEGRLSPEVIAERERREAARHFETTVAPLLAKHCLECHDSATHENGLDLSKKVAAFKGSDNGPSIVPGNAAESPLWAAVESDSMPLDRPSLTAAEKGVLQEWINKGAVWSLDEIDPAVYVHGGSHQDFVRRLTVDEYIETVRSTMGVDIGSQARELLPQDLRADGFSNTAYNLNVDYKHVGAYAALAEKIVQQIDVGEFVARFSNRRKFTDKDMEHVISRVGQWILRGPVSKREIIDYRGITTTVASAGGSFDEAMGLVLEAMLQSPRFIYRVESQPRGDAHAAVNDFELASRLSYIIWGGPPDEELLKLAQDGQLKSQLQSQAKRMLNDPRAVQQSRRFVSDWLNLGRLKNLQPNSERFPAWSPELAADMRDETLEYFEEVVWKQRKPMTALLNSQLTYASPRLAQFYNLPGSDEAKDGRTYDLTSVPGRGGLLTHGSVLTVGGDDASMVTRGLLVMHELLRGVVKDPPPCVDTTPVPTKPGLTQRSIAMQRIGNSSCGGCHSRFEPLAFGLEKFDGIGAWHEQDEHGNKLRDDGEILVPGSAEPVKYASSAELMDMLADSERVSQSLTWKVTQFALGRPLGAEDAAVVASIHSEATADGGTWPDLLTAIVSSDLVLNK